MSTMSNTEEKDNPCLKHWFHMSKSTKFELKMTNNSVVTLKQCQMFSVDEGRKP